MNDHIDLTKILKDCPRGTEFYSPIWGKMFFEIIISHPDEDFPVRLKNNNNEWVFLTKEGKYNHIYKDSECILFPSKDQRDWNKFTATWLKKERFDPKTLQPFDRVIVRNIQNNIWHVQLFSHIEEKHTQYPFFCLCDSYAYCIPYNDETKHLVSTKDEAPEFYRY